MNFWFHWYCWSFYSDIGFYYDPVTVLRISPVAKVRRVESQIKRIYCRSRGMVGAYQDRKREARIRRIVRLAA